MLLYLPIFREKIEIWITVENPDFNMLSSTHLKHYSGQTKHISGLHSALRLPVWDPLADIMFNFMDT